MRFNKLHFVITTCGEQCTFTLLDELIHQIEVVVNKGYTFRGMVMVHILFDADHSGAESEDFLNRIRYGYQQEHSFIQLHSVCRGNDFAHMRNWVRQYIPENDFIFYLDADEFVMPYFLSNLLFYLYLFDKEEIEKYDVFSFPRANTWYGEDTPIEFDCGYTEELPKLDWDALCAFDWTKRDGYGYGLGRELKLDGFPDFQTRLMRNKPGLNWRYAIHATLDWNGSKSFGLSYGGLILLHHKKWVPVEERYWSSHTERGYEDLNGEWNTKDWVHSND